MLKKSKLRPGRAKEYVEERKFSGPAPDATNGLVPPSPGYGGTLMPPPFEGSAAYAVLTLAPMSAPARSVASNTTPATGTGAKATHARIHKVFRIGISFHALGCGINKAVLANSGRL